jgi:hypothetical protein
MALQIPTVKELSSGLFDDIPADDRSLIKEIIGAIDNDKSDDSILEQINETADGEDSNWIILFNSGIYLNHFHRDEGLYDELIIKVFEKALNRGLNYKSSTDNFIEAAKILARLTCKYQNYKEANNYLLLLRDLSNEDLPPWVFNYSARITSKLNFKSYLVNPSAFFSFLRQARQGTSNISDQQVSIVKEFLNTVIHKIQVNNLPSENIDSFLLNVEDSIQDYLDVVGKQWDELTSLSVTNKTDEIDDDSKNIDENIEHYEQLRQLLSKYELQLESNNEEIIELKAANKELKENLSQIKNRYREDLKKLADQATGLDEKKSKSIIRGKILVIGSQGVPERQLMGIAEEYFGLIKNDIDFKLDYKKNKRLDVSKLRYNSPYCGFLVGPIAHKVIGLGDNNSFIQKMKKEEGYPPFVEIRTKSGKLKITKTSFKQALDELMAIIGANEPEE